MINYNYFGVASCVPSVQLLLPLSNIGTLLTRYKLQYNWSFSNVILHVFKMSSLAICGQEIAAEGSLRLDKFEITVPSKKVWDFLIKFYYYSI
jgi:hypothetical protein